MDAPREAVCAPTGLNCAGICCANLLDIPGLTQSRFFICCFVSTEALSHTRASTLSRGAPRRLEHKVRACTLEKPKRGDFAA